MKAIYNLSEKKSEKMTKRVACKSNYWVPKSHHWDLRVHWAQAVSTKIFISCPVGPFKIWSALWRRLLSRREEAKQGIPFWPLNSDQMLVWILVNKPRNGGRNASWVSCCLVTCLLRCLCLELPPAIQTTKLKVF